MWGLIPYILYILHSYYYIPHSIRDKDASNKDVVTGINFVITFGIEGAGIKYAGMRNVKKHELAMICIFCVSFCG
jgi:hypothetical protein